MIIELSHFALALALAVAILQAISGLGTTTKKTSRLRAFAVQNSTVANRAAWALFALCLIAFLGLEVAYITSDFSVVNVFTNSHSLKPLLYKITGVWGNHEGSMLLWILMLTFFGFLIARMPMNDNALRTKALGIQGLLATGFIAFSLFASNPFTRTDTPPFDGNSLNPVLQDMGLAFHPPTLYLGYVGFSSVFSLAAAGLLTGRIDKNWARTVKPFVAIAWLALSAGIALGAKWAYYELGWGGWWFWDPVEDASLLPWLAGTALLHSLLVLGSRDALKRWTVLLAVAVFSLSLLGTFLVRSGILSSVHAFAVDPLRGSFILALLALYCGGAFALYAWRAPALKTVRLFAPASREGGIVLNNLLLSAMAATVLTGTLYPLVMDALKLEQISVGAPYYNATVGALALPLFLLAGLGPFLPWKRPGRWTFLKPLAICAAIALAATLACRIESFLPAATFGAGIWLITASLAHAWQARKSFSLKTLAITLGHAGMGLAVIGTLGTSVWKKEDIRVVNSGDRFTVGRHELQFDGVKDAFGPNYGAYEATIRLGNNETLHPQKRWYPVSESETTEAAIRLTALDDLYIVLGDRDKEGWVLRTTVHPFVSALWSGFALIVLAGIAVLLHRRRA